MCGLLAYIGHLRQMTALIACNVGTAVGSTLLACRNAVQAFSNEDLLEHLHGHEDRQTDEKQLGRGGQSEDCGDHRQLAGDTW